MTIVQKVKEVDKIQIRTQHYPVIVGVIEVQVSQVEHITGIDQLQLMVV